MRLFLSLALLLTLGCASEPAPESAAEQPAAGAQAEEWIALFNGEDLTGWDGDPEVWSVRDGMIVGSTDDKEIETNTFLIYEEPFADFVLEAEIKLRNHNSGIQFRSERVEGEQWVMRGYQADAAEGNWWGSLYGEKTGRGVIQNGWVEKGQTVVNAGDWNTVRITCDGDHIRIELNGLTTVDLHDDMAREGLVALQVHRGPKMEVYFRNLRLKRL